MDDDDDDDDAKTKVYEQYLHVHSFKNGIHFAPKNCNHETFVERSIGANERGTSTRAGTNFDKNEENQRARGFVRF